MSPETAFIGNLIGAILEKLMLQDQENNLEKRQELLQKSIETGFNIAEYTSALAEANLAVEHADLAIQQQEAVLIDMEAAKASDEIIMQFMSNCLTNSEFYDWYIGQMSSVYKASYDTTLSFCRLAESIFQQETGMTSTFVRPNWNSTYKGLLAPYSLALDLERMDLAYTQYILNENSEGAEQSILLSQQRTIGGQMTVVESLLERGEAVFEITEEIFDEYYPDRYDRRIQDIRVIFPELQKNGLTPHARLTQLSNCRYYTRNRDAVGGKILKNLLAHQSMTLSAAETDTRALTKPSRRLGTFQGTGVHATWHLSIPAVVKAIQENPGEIPHHTMLKENLKEIILEVTYTAKW